MPAAISEISIIETQSDYGSEESSTTESSMNLATVTGRTVNASGANKKFKKPTSRRSVKKPLKFGYQKPAAIINLKSQIPRPSFSTTPSSTSRSPSVSEKSLSPSPRSYPAPTIRQQPVQRSSVHFQLKKSLSQMDFKQSRRSGYNQRSSAVPTSSSMVVPLSSQCNSVALLPAMSVSNSRSTFIQNTSSSSYPMTDEYYYVLQEPDAKAAGLKIFATIMLNAWRRRRDDVKRLVEEVERLKKGSIKIKNQIHVLNSVYRIEQKQNDELSCRLRRSMDDIHKTKNSCENLSTTVISLKADKSLLEQQLQSKEYECDGLNALLSETKSHLFKAMSHQRELHSCFSAEQRNVQMLENQKNELLSEIYKIKTESRELEEKYQEELEKKSSEVDEAKKDLKSMETLCLNLKEKEFQIREYVQSDVKLKSEIETLKAEVNALKGLLDESIGNRIKSFWHNTITFQRSTLQIAHLLVFYLLPATPPPKITTFPITFNLDKALSIVKGGC